MGRDMERSFQALLMHGTRFDGVFYVGVSVTRIYCRPVCTARWQRSGGLANGRNPFSIIVPCHRVVGANGKLIGYAGGVQRRQVLLSLKGGNLTDGFSYKSPPSSVTIIAKNNT